MMRMLALCLAISGCATEAASDFEFGQSVPSQDDSKTDEPRVCGDESCVPMLCGYDCTSEGEQCKRSCAEENTREKTFVEASGSVSFDSRTNPYMPVFSLNNVLVYGCELWDYSNGEEDGLQIQYEELIHSSFVVDPNDPTRTAKDFALYVEPLLGPGSYRAQARYRAAHDAPVYAGREACSVDISADGAGLSGTFDCSLPAQQGSGTINLRGSFACGEDSMRPIFSRWAAAPL